MPRSDPEFTALKNKKKKQRTILEILVLIILAGLIINALFTFTQYQPYSWKTAEFDGDKGFVALSYYGVDRTGTGELIGEEQLEHHLEVLKNNGFVTITGTDIQDYYQKGKQLPRRALFLSFQDGRRDTAIFVEKLLEKYNYHAMMSTYAENLRGDDMKFLHPEELTDLTKHGYWELGSNGYRLYYINVFDRWRHYLGNMNPVVYAHLTSVLGRNYNHYLMDYIRDDTDFPVESYQVMKDRISNDYLLMRDIYTKDIGYVPEIYTLMHSNTGRFGNHADVSSVNEYWIRKLFRANFNREGDSHNWRNSSIYDLTSMAPRSYWPANHLLMRIKHDGVPDITFEKGDSGQYAAWELQKGAAEFRDEAIILTTEPKERGLMKLRDSNAFTDILITVDVKGNEYGSQQLYLRADDALENYLVVELINNNLVVGQRLNGAYTEIEKIDLDRFEGKACLSVEEDQQRVAMEEQKVLARYAANTASAKEQLKRRQEEGKKTPRTVAEGAPEFREALSYHKRGERKLQIKLQGDRLSVKLDDKDAVKDRVVLSDASGSLFLGARWPGYGYSQINLADDVYDAVFDGLKVESLSSGQGSDPVLYDVHYQGIQKYKQMLAKLWLRILDWVLAHF